MRPNYRKVWNTSLTHFYPKSVPNLSHFKMGTKPKVFAFRGIATSESHFTPRTNLLISGVPEIPHVVPSENFLSLSQSFAELFSGSIVPRFTRRQS